MPQPLPIQQPLRTNYWYRNIPELIYGTRPDLVREDKTIKGLGFLGEMPHKLGGYSTELSITTGDVEDGKDVLIPTMIPTLSKDELNYLLTTKYNPRNRTRMDDVIFQKAVDFARQRKAKGLPYFATPEEEGKFTIK